MAARRSTWSALPLWFSVAPALTALAMIGRLTSDRGGVLPRWAEWLILLGSLGLAVLPLGQRLVLRRQR